MKIAIISDLHIGDGARSRDLMVNGSDQAPDNKYLHRFCEFLRENQLSADYLVIPGDITNRAEVQEFVLGSQVIEKIASGLGVATENIIFSPGNHDSSWAQIERANKDGVLAENQPQYAFLPMFQDGSLIFKRQLGRGGGSFDSSPYFVTWEFGDAIFISINSSASITPDDAHKSGSVSTEQIAAIDDWLARNADQIEGKARIAVIHHHPINYHDTTFTVPDVTALQNAVGLLDVLWKFKFDLLIHGHKHIPRFSNYANAVGCPINLLCAGSFSAKLQEAWFATVGNMFHLIEVHGRDSESYLAKGLLRTWSFHVGHGWIESEEKFHAIAHLNYFGNFISIHEAKQYLKVAINGAFENSQIIRWCQFAESDAKIRYLPNKQLIQVLQELSKSESFDLLGVDKGFLSSLDKLALIKQVAS